MVLFQEDKNYYFESGKRYLSNSGDFFYEAWDFSEVEFPGRRLTKASFRFEFGISPDRLNCSQFELEKAIISEGIFRTVYDSAAIETGKNYKESGLIGVVFRAVRSNVDKKGKQDLKDHLAALNKLKTIGINAFGDSTFLEENLEYEVWGFKPRSKKPAYKFMEIRLRGPIETFPFLGTARYVPKKFEQYSLFEGEILIMNPFVAFDKTTGRPVKQQTVLAPKLAQGMIESLGLYLDDAIRFYPDLITQ